MNFHIKQSRQFIQLIDLLVKLKVIGITRHKVSIAMLWGTKQPIVDPTWIPLASVSTYSNYIQIISIRNRSYG
jgi:hypothetical protein